MKSKFLTITLSCLFAFLLIAQSAQSQHSKQTKTITFEQGEVTLLQGIGALIIAGDDGLKIEMIPPKDQRQKEYKDVDLKNQDRIIMCNGKKLKTIADLEAIIEKIEIGGEISFGIKRGKEMMIASFPKADPKDSGNMMMMTTTIDDDGGTNNETTIMKDGVALKGVVMLEAGFILKDVDGKPSVIAVLPGLEDNIDGELLKEGDIILSLNGEKELSSKELEEKYNGFKVGDMLSITFSRGSESFTIELKKQPPPQGEVIIRKEEGSDDKQL